MSKRILIIEDDFMTVEPIVTHLRINGHEVELADTALDAVERLSSATYDYIFLDVMFAPGDVFNLEDTHDGRYTGLELLKAMRIKGLQGASHARVALITNWRDEPRVDRYAEDYNATIFRKPLLIGQIEEFIK